MQATLYAAMLVRWSVDLLVVHLGFRRFAGSFISHHCRAWDSIFGSPFVSGESPQNTIYFIPPETNEMEGENGSDEKGFFSIY